MRWADGEAERLANSQPTPRPRLKPETKTEASPIYYEYTASDGRPYYWNPVTGTSQWEKPSDGPVHSTNYLAMVNSPMPAMNQSYLGHSNYGCNLFVFHLPNEWTEADLRSHFGIFGNVTSAKIMVDRETRKSRGYGFVNFDNPHDAAKAMHAMNGHQVAGKRLKVQIKKEKHN